jgi:hypothetical protein
VKIVWDDLVVSPYAMAPGAAAPDPITLFGTGSIRGFGFDGGVTSEMMDGCFQLSHRWVEDTPAYIHVHWMPSTTGSGNVIWNLEYSMASAGQVFTAPATISTAATAAGGVAWYHHITSFPVIQMPSKKVSSLIEFRFYRNPGATGDTYAADAVLCSLDLHYAINTDGSRLELQK